MPSRDHWHPSFDMPPESLQPLEVREAHGFVYHLTKDGSPTLFAAPLDPEAIRAAPTALSQAEPMHSLQGALSESLWVYGPALLRTYQRQPLGGHIAVVGLGLGTLEMAAAALCAAGCGAPGRVTSFESEPSLQEAFVGFVQGGRRGPWELMAEQMEHRLNIPRGEVRRVLEGWLQKGVLTVQGPLQKEALAAMEPHPFHAVLFDAYSDRTSPALWEEGLLQKTLDATDEDCVFASYAARGGLNRLLRARGFLLEARGGFAGKRASTWAERVRPCGPQILGAN